MNRILSLFFLVGTFLCTSLSSAFSQLTVVSFDGYSVNINITPIAIVPLSNPCPYGYNYDVKLQYTVSFSGSNQPASLYTLQGIYGCGSDSHFFDLPNNPSSGFVNSMSNVWRSNTDCAVSTVSSLNCNTVTIQIAGPGIGYRSITFTTNFLPVKLVSFSTAIIDNKVKLNWTTASEDNFQYFTIEKEKAGSGIWTAIATVNAQGGINSLAEYSWYDEVVENGAFEYRLAMVDKNGAVEYSPIKLIKYNKDNATVGVYPNPGIGRSLNFSGITGNPADYSFSIFDISGTVICSQILTSRVAVIPNLHSGVYVIRINNHKTNEVTNLRYIK